MEQIWFAGVHSDVGGGYLDPCLSDIPLAWMMKKAISKGLIFDQVKFEKYTNAASKCAQAPINSSWKLIPYGPSAERVIPAGSNISNSVTMKMKTDPKYQPINLSGNFTNWVSGNTNLENGMQIAEVLS